MLGLPQAELDRHIGIDIGILGVGSALSEMLDATLIHQPYSRLVIDCNRHPERPDAMPAVSDGTRVPGNLGLTAPSRAARVAAIFTPYHRRIAAEIGRRLAQGRAPMLVALHSFTPHHGDHPAPRPWHIGVSWLRDERLARPLIAALGEDRDVVVGANVPYGISDSIDYAIPVHAEARGLVHVEVEIRQDLIADAAGQGAWADRLARALGRALADLDHPGPPVQG
jgi:predicted N-formylglutamate amidohydrolase